MNLTYTINFEPIIRWYIYGIISAIPLSSYYVMKSKKNIMSDDLVLAYEWVALNLLSWIIPIMCSVVFLLDLCKTQRDKAIQYKYYKKFYILNTLLFWFRKDSAIFNYTYVANKWQMGRHLGSRSKRLEMVKVSYRDIVRLNKLCGKDKMIDEELLDEDFFDKNRYEYWVWENVDDTLKYVRSRLVSRFIRRYPNRYFYFSFSRLFGEIRVRRAIKKAKTDKERRYYERMLED